MPKLLCGIECFTDNKILNIHSRKQNNTIQKFPTGSSVDRDNTRDNTRETTLGRGEPGMTTDIRNPRIKEVEVGSSGM